MPKPVLTAEAEAAWDRTIPNYNTREEWLEAAIELCSDIFEEAGYKVPAVKVSCSFPGGGSANTRIGECWSREASASKVNEMFISPYLDDVPTVLGVLVHEMCHAVDNCASKHGKGFRAIATAVGLEGKMRSTTVGEGLAAELAITAEVLGPYPHGKLQRLERAKRAKRAAPRFRCDDGECDYIFSVPPRIFEAKGAPSHCPACSGALKGNDGGGEED